MPWFLLPSRLPYFAAAGSLQDRLFTLRKLRQIEESEVPAAILAAAEDLELPPSPMPDLPPALATELSRLQDITSTTRRDLTTLEGLAADYWIVEAGNSAHDVLRPSEFDAKWKNLSLGVL